MPEKILPSSVSGVISSRLDRARVYELRLRADRPVVINYGGRYYFLTPSGLSDSADGAVVLGSDDVHAVVVRATEFSLYAVNNKLVRGYITISGGVRLGVCGDVVTGSGEARTIKDFTSVNIRIPHEIKGCARLAASYIRDTEMRSALIVAPPGAGNGGRFSGRICCEKGDSIL